MRDARGVQVDEVRTPHVTNVRHAQWNMTLRLFLRDEDISSSRTAPVVLVCSLMDKNNKKADYLIGDVKLELHAGSGKVKVEVPSRCVSSCRPHIFFHYEVTPQMFFEHVEWTRVVQ